MSDTPTQRIMRPADPCCEARRRGEHRGFVAGVIAAAALVAGFAAGQAQGSVTIYQEARAINPGVARATRILDRCLLRVGDVTRTRSRCIGARQLVQLRAGSARTYIAHGHPWPAPRCTTKLWRPVQLRAYTFALSASALGAGLAPLIYLDLYRAAQAKANRRAAYCLRLANR